MLNPIFFVFIIIPIITIVNMFIRIIIIVIISVSEAAEQRGWRLLVATCSYLPLVAATLYSHTHCFFLVHIFISSSVAGGRVSNDLSLEMGGS